MKTIHATGTGVRHALARALATANLSPAEATFRIAAARVSLDERRRVSRGELTVDLHEPRPVGDWSPTELVGLVNPDGDHPLMVRLPPRPGLGVLRPYFLDILPVSQERWERVSGEAPAAGSDPLWPRVDVDLDRARHFASQAGKRLPSAAELDLAWGPHNLPWGAEPDPSLGRAGAPRFHVLPEIGLHPPSPWGLFDLGAWLWQWTSEGLLTGGANRELTLPPGATQRSPPRESMVGVAPHPECEPIGLRLAVDG